MPLVLRNYHFFTINGYVPLPVDPYVFKNIQTNSFFVLWVDDIIPISPTLNKLSYMKELIASKYKIKDMGKLQDYLGISIIRNCPERSLVLTQKIYARKNSR